MRFGFLILFGIITALSAERADAHLADEFPQVTLQIAIDDEAVELIVTIPAKDAKLAVFDGLSPVEMDMMEPADLAALVGPVFAKRCPVMIDGVVVPPTIFGAVVKMSNSRLPARRFPEPQVLKQGALKFLARYETKGSPRRVSFDWLIYSNEYDEANKPIHDDAGLQVVGLVNAAGKEYVLLLTPEEPGYVWHAEDAAQLPDFFSTSNPPQLKATRVPVPSLAILIAGLICGGVMLARSKPRAIGLVVFSLIAAGVCLPYGNHVIEHGAAYAVPEDDEALAIFESLHRNIYRAFDYTDEGAVYDALAQSVDGAMLETIYNDVYQSLIMREENGAVSKVVRVEIDEADLLPVEADDQAIDALAYRVHCTWQVDGLVTHYGHSHARTNAFEAIYTVAPRGEGWRIVDAEILQQRRIDDGTQTAEDLLKAP
ncbi:MAG: hypothetical protein AB8C95_12010 [Phycisphaeraceae bacterium]